MELRHLRYFVAVAETENVSRAALKLHVSQPALSRQIKDLENEIGFLLLERSAKSVRLTDAGRIFLTEARAVLARTEEAVKAARAVATGLRGELNVGYAPTPTVRILPPTLRAFQAERPSVRVKLHDLTTDEMIAGLRKGALHIALLVRPNRALLRGLHFEELARDQIRLAVPRSHRFARLRAISIARMAGEALVAYNRKEYPDYHELLATLFVGTKTQPRIVEEYEGGGGLVTAVEAGTGLALVAQSLSCSIGPRLKLIPITPSPAPIIIGAAWARDRYTPAAEQFFRCAQGVKAG